MIQETMNTIKILKENPSTFVPVRRKVILNQLVDLVEENGRFSKQNDEMKQELKNLKEENDRLYKLNDSLNTACNRLSDQLTTVRQVLASELSKSHESQSKSESLPTSTICLDQKIPECAEERDPHGKSSHEAGAKLDHGKQRPHLVLKGFDKALRAVTEVGTFGAQKYTDNGWRTVPNGSVRYADALWRHLLASDERDDQSGLPHLWHALWNLMAIISLSDQDHVH